MWPANYQTHHTSSNAASCPLLNPNLYPTSLNSHQNFPSHQCIATLYSQSSYTSSLVLAGDFLFSGSSDKEIRLWKCSTLSSLSGYNDCDDYQNIVVAGHGAVKALLASSEKLISAHQDHKIRVWKINVDGQKAITHLATLPTLSDRALTMLIPKNHIQVRRHKTQTWVHHVDTVTALALSSDELLLYSVSWDRTLKIWSTSDFKCLESVANAHNDAINAIALSDDGHVYTGSSDMNIKVWKREPGNSRHSLVDTLEKHNSGVNALALTQDGTVLYSGSSDRSIAVWMMINGGMEVITTLRGHKMPVLCLAILSESVLCSGSADASVRIWRGAGASYSCLAVLEGHKGPVKCITGAYEDQGSSSSSGGVLTYKLYSASLDCDIKVWEIFVPVS